MKVIVVIGGIGSGKSSVSRALASHGAAFIDLDEVGHVVLLHDSIIDELAATFGIDILDASGSIVRAKLAQAAFETPESTRRLNEITHPRLVADARALLAEYEQAKRAAATIEISPYDGPQGSFGVFTDQADAVIAVVAPLEVRVARAVGRGFAEMDVRNRIARQVTDEQRRLWADYVVENDGTLEQLTRRVDDIWKDIVGVA